MPRWRNWQTRYVEVVVPAKGLEVRVLSSAPLVILEDKSLAIDNTISTGIWVLCI